MNPTVQLIEPEVRELIAGNRYRDLRMALADLEPADIADVMRELDADASAIAFRMLPRDKAGDVLAELADPEIQQRLLEGLRGAALRALEEMDPDDRAELLDEMPSDLAQRIIATLSPAERRRTQLILGYPIESVGRLMTPDYVRVKPQWTVQESIDHLRRYGRDAETVHWVYVVDSRGRLLDDLHIRKLLLAEPDATIESLMDNSFIALDATDDQEDAVRLLARYDRTALPVVDSRGMLLGIVTHDDVTDVATEEATEDIQKLGGVEALDAPYMKVGAVEMLRKRGVILSILLVAQTITIGVVGFFEERIAKVLLVFMPLIIACGGNTATQAASLIVRALALEEVKPGEWLRVIGRELVTAVGLGLIMGVLSALAVNAWNLTPTVDLGSPWSVGGAVGLSVLFIVLWGVSIGSMSPLILEKIGLDPATISSPLVATMMDVSGLVIYFSLVLLMGVGG